MAFTREEKAAIVSLIIEMINCDGSVTYEELIATNVIVRELDMDHDTFNMGIRLKPEHAIALVARMDDKKKIAVGKLLTRAIDADGKVETQELALLGTICRATDIDALLK